MYFRTNKNAVKEYKIGDGWPEYKNVTVNEMERLMEDNIFRENSQNDMYNEENTVPRYTTMPGNSTYSYDNAMDIRDRELMKKLYLPVNKFMMPYVVRIVAEFDYVGSPIYDVDGIDRETLAQITSRVLDLAQRDNDEIEEIRTEQDVYPMKWNRNILIKNLTQSLVLCYIFTDRRPRYRAISGNYGY